MKFDFAEQGNIWAQVLFLWHLVCQKEMVYNKNSSYGNHRERGSSEHIKHSEVGFKCHPLQNKMITIAPFKITIVLFTSRGNSKLHRVLYYCCWMEPFSIIYLTFVDPSDEHGSCESDNVNTGFHTQCLMVKNEFQVLMGKRKAMFAPRTTRWMRGSLLVQRRTLNLVWCSSGFMEILQLGTTGKSNITTPLDRYVLFFFFTL